MGRDKISRNKKVRIRKKYDFKPKDSFQNKLLSRSKRSLRKLPLDGNISNRVDFASLMCDFIKRTLLDFCYIGMSRGCSLLFLQKEDFNIKEIDSVQVVDISGNIRYTVGFPLWTLYLNYLITTQKDISFSLEEKNVNSYTKEIIEALSKVIKEFSDKNPLWSVYSENDPDKDKKEWTYKNNTPQLYVCDNCITWNFFW